MGRGRGAMTRSGYLDRVSFGMIADWDLVPDLPDFGQAVDASVAELRSAAERR